MNLTNLTTASRALVGALALAAAAFGFIAQTAHTAPAPTTVLADDPEPVEVNEAGQPDLSED